MTRNEKIAEKMGWTISDYIDGGYDISDIGKNDAAGHWLSHLLIERMVGDGWKITMINWPPIAGQKPFKKFTFYAEKFTDERSFVDFKSEHNDFPAAVVELFCRVYGIKED